MKRPALTVLFAFIFGLAGVIRAEIYSVKLVSSAQVNCWSLEEIVAALTAGITNERDKALALHRFGMAHQIHFIGPYEGGRYVHDALKLLGVYGYDLCGNNSAAMCALYNLAGMKARRRSLVGHVVPEVWFEGKWNYIDTDMFGFVYLPGDQKIASVDELIANPDLWLRQGKKPDPFFPFDPPESMKEAFINPEGDKDYHSYSLAHIMRLGLRTSESVTCYYRPQGRFYIDPRAFPHELGTQWRSYWVDGPIRQNSLAWTDTVPAAYGNGVFEYEPDLRSQAFLLENPEMDRVKVNDAGQLPSLVASAKGLPASIVLDVLTPWVIAGFENDLTNFQDNSEAAVVSGWFWRIKEEDESRIMVSVDGGRSWKKAWENTNLGAVPFRVDVTRYVEGKSGYKVKFEWVDRGGSGQAGLEGLKLTTWVELSPMALPRLVPGKNVIKVSTSPHVACLADCFWLDQETLPGEKQENLILSSSDSPRLQPADRQKNAILTFSPGTGGIVDELRVAIGAQSLPGGKIEDASVVLFLSENETADWQELERFRPNPEQQFTEMWFNHIIRDRSLDGSRCRLKIELKGCGLNQVTANSLVRVTPKIQNTLHLSHVYQAGGRRQTVNWLLAPGAQNTSYEIEVLGEKVLNESLKVEAMPPEEK